MKRISAVLAGNPNAGKTTLFNLLTGLRQRTGNWPGVTVERKQGTFATGEASVTLIDLPGIYSLEKVQPGDGLSADERVTCSYVMSGQADVLINVVDASSLEKSLWLTLQLRELNLPMIVVLNMADVARSCGVALDSDALAAQLGCPVVLMSASTAEGVTALLAAIDSVAAAPPADLLLNRAELDAEARLARISAICQAACDRGSHRAHRLTRALDNLFLHRWLGFPLFLGVMYLMFFFSINIGGALQPVFDKGSAALFVDGTAQLCAALHFPDWLTSFLAQGIGGGITTVLPLVPQLALMFFFSDAAGGVGLYGARRLCGRSPDALARAAGEIFRAAHRRLWLQRAGGDGRAHAGNRARAADDDADGALYVLRRPAGDIRRFFRRLFRQCWRWGDFFRSICSASRRRCSPAWC
ncbi:50S ribosome-binding GTPase [Pantoea tagorei]